MTSRFVRVLSSSIGKKLVMAASGLLLVGFLVAHLAGNLTLLAGDGEAFDAYAHKLRDTAPLLYVVEIGLLALFLVHIAMAFRVSMENREARGVGYVVRADRGKKTLGSSSMLVTGALVGAFLIVHLVDFRFDSRFEEGPAQLVSATLTQPWKLALYLLSFGVLFVHLSHAFKSALQTLGINHPRYVGAIRVAGWSVAGLLAGGFALIPLALLAKA
jgi:succinate dehydrogenase / fumarate reductase cytochrome b subunit